MKKFFKANLFILGFSLLLLFLNTSKVDATVKTLKTLQELQETMGATEHSIIDGTTLKITSNFSWTIPTEDNNNIKIPQLTIDFNGKEIKVLNDKETNIGIHLLEGKVIFKDSQEGTGGIFSKGNFICLDNQSELLIENGKYTAGHVQEINNGLITNIDNGLFKNQGGIITVKNGEFDTLEHAILFKCEAGKLTINNGNFTGKGYFVEIDNRNINMAWFRGCS